MQAVIGGLVAKTLTTSSTNPYAQGGAGARAAPVALDVFSVQVCAAINCLHALRALCSSAICWLAAKRQLSFHSYTGAAALCLRVCWLTYCVWFAGLCQHFAGTFCVHCFHQSVVADPKQSYTIAQGSILMQTLLLINALIYIKQFLD